MFENSSQFWKPFRPVLLLSPGHLIAQGVSQARQQSACLPTCKKPQFDSKVLQKGEECNYNMLLHAYTLKIFTIIGKKKKQPQGWRRDPTLVDI